MLDMSLRPSESRDRMGETSLQRIEAFSPETFARNALDLASCARGESRPLTHAAKLMLRGLIGVRKHG